MYMVNKAYYELLTVGPMDPWMTPTPWPILQ